MSGSQLVLLVIIFLITSTVSVVTGSTSLITVPAMLQFHIEPRTALATNMFALTFMSLGASIPLMKNNAVERRRLPLLTGLTLVGSIIGAVLLLLVPTRSLSIIVPTAMIAVAVFSVIYRKAGSVEQSLPPSARTEMVGYVLTFLLGIYGGFFSGGYVTILTAIFVAAFRTSFREAIATTKLMNLFSSAVATAIFMWHGLVNYKLGLILGATMFLGAALGARFVTMIAEKWLCRIFLTAVWVLGLKALFLDILGKAPTGSTQFPATEH
jgi:uncharacterized protein